MASSTKPEVHNVRIALPSEEDRATATGNMTYMYRKFGEIWTYICVVLGICEQTDRQTEYRQTYRHNDRNALPSYGGQ